MVLIIPLMGFNQATNTLVSNLIGAGRNDEVLKLINKVIVLCLLFTSTLLIIAWLSPQNTILLYTNDTSLVPLAISTMKIISMTVYFFCIASVLFNGVIGTGNTKATLIMELINISVYMIATWYIAIYLRLELEAVWSSEFIYFSVLGIMAFWYLKKGNWKKAIV